MRSRVFVVSLLCVLALTACTTGVTEPDATGPTATSKPSAPTTIAIPSVTIPADCKNLVDAETYASTFGTTSLNDPAIAENYPLGNLPISTAPAGAGIDEVVDAGTQLRCVWRDPGADVTYLQAEIGTVGAEVGAEYLEKLRVEGYTCDETLDGTRCAITGTDPQYQVETGDTVFVRGDMVVRIDQANVSTENLLAAVVATLWHD
jgi:hypothetical protein